MRVGMILEGSGWVIGRCPDLEREFGLRGNVQQNVVTISGWRDVQTMRVKIGSIELGWKHTEMSIMALLLELRLNLIWRFDRKAVVELDVEYVPRLSAKGRADKLSIVRTQVNWAAPNACRIRLRILHNETGLQHAITRNNLWRIL